MTNPDVALKEKKEIFENDRKVMNTYHAFAQSSVDDERGGRYAAVSRPATVIGASPVSYPKLPADSPSNQLAMSPKEEPLGYSVDDMEAVGERWEQEASKSTGRPKSRLRRL
jgi:hypothetical protein